ncbi:hypothetical protein PPERSA_00725 [Pseudocohnilembus persalinus]|uniref:PCI domain-containing protein n=1 Tax=Pseudocohnilembus persalinus TaxID=266149 RepID=A0A0V0R4N5_PSEPJ|nr:hypothetical protein PPERSA_00725 [Pseudocohnilembus persalinus]|eukprot:KRX09446.1 hypothetical protein PPERSA_00725 [Pseudocohnilembus persalinus]
MEEELTFEQQLQKFDDKIKDAEENLGDQEIKDAHFERAQLYDKYEKYEKAIELYNETYKLTVGFGPKMDVIFKILLIYVKLQDLDQIKIQIDRCNKLFEEGGDWERKNRLKVYEGIYFLMIRDFKSTSKLFLQTISTFNSPEIISYNKLVYYTVLTSLISLPRSEIKEKIVHSPEVLSAIRDIENLKDFLDSFYKCDYKKFFQVFASIISDLPNDLYLAPHRKYFTREMRVVIYSQFLESYKTVELQSMANAFGVSVSFIDKELSELIAAKRLNCKIDKVSGIVEGERIDERNRLYKTAIRDGDFLLNKIQKLSRALDI